MLSARMIFDPWISRARCYWLIVFLVGICQSRWGGCGHDFLLVWYLLIWDLLGFEHGAFEVAGWGVFFFSIDGRCRCSACAVRIEPQLRLTDSLQPKYDVKALAILSCL